MYDPIYADRMLVDGEKHAIITHAKAKSRWLAGKARDISDDPPLSFDGQQFSGDAARHYWVQRS